MASKHVMIFILFYFLCVAIHVCMLFRLLLLCVLYIFFAVACRKKVLNSVHIKQI